MPEQMFELAFKGIKRSGRRKPALHCAVRGSRAGVATSRRTRLAEVHALLPEAVRAKQA